MRNILNHVGLMSYLVGPIIIAVRHLDQCIIEAQRDQLQAAQKNRKIGTQKGTGGSGCITVYVAFAIQREKSEKKKSVREREIDRSKMFLRAVARPLMAKVKETTGIVGLDVVPNAREVLIGLYSKTLKEIQKVPEDEGYRKAVESFTNHRLKVCQEEEDWETIEKRLACGQVEELIEEAQDELKLISHMIGMRKIGEISILCSPFIHVLLCVLLLIVLILI